MYASLGKTVSRKRPHSKVSPPISSSREDDIVPKSKPRVVEPAQSPNGPISWSLNKAAVDSTQIERSRHRKWGPVPAASVASETEIQVVVEATKPRAQAIPSSQSAQDARYILQQRRYESDMMSSIGMPNPESDDVGPEIVEGGKQHEDAQTAKRMNKQSSPRKGNLKARESAVLSAEIFENLDGSTSLLNGVSSSRLRSHFSSYGPVVLPPNIQSSPNHDGDSNPNLSHVEASSTTNFALYDASINRS